jgi:hypothetical protein
VEVDGVLAGHHLILAGAAAALLLRHLRSAAASAFLLCSGSRRRRREEINPSRPRQGRAFIAARVRAPNSPFANTFPAHVYQIRPI